MRARKNMDGRRPAQGSASPVVVVGAGSAGLAAAAALQRRRIEVVVLERGPSVATSWRGRHEELRLNTIRWLSDLPGLRMPRSLGRWVTRDDYVDYLERFAQHQRLDVRFDVHVDRLDPSPGGWRVATSAGDHKTDQVVVATGYDRVPSVPDWPGRDQFPKPVMHVAEHRRAADLAGLQVLLVGAGNSGVEIAGHLVDAGVGALWVSVRTPPSLLPREVGGLPLHPLSRWLRVLPERLRDANARMIARLAFGDLAPHGLPAPAQGPYERLRTTGVTVAVDQGFVRHLKAGHLEIVAEVDRFAGSEVLLRDGRRLRPDIVLAATGFCRGLEPLAGHLDVLDAAGLPRGGSGMPTPGAPGLWFTGYRTAIEGNLRQHPIEARRIADAITQARSKVPSRFRLHPRRTDHGETPIPHGDPPTHRGSQPALAVPGQGQPSGHATAAHRAQPVGSRAGMRPRHQTRRRGHTPKDAETTSRDSTPSPVGAHETQEHEPDARPLWTPRRRYRCGPLRCASARFRPAALVGADPAVPRAVHGHRGPHCGERGAADDGHRSPAWTRPR